MEALNASYRHNKSDAIRMSMMNSSSSNSHIVLAVDDLSTMDMSASVVGVSTASGRIKNVSVEEITMSWSTRLTTNGPRSSNSIT